jgi:hypothetical protein
MAVGAVRTKCVARFHGRRDKEKPTIKNNELHFSRSNLKFKVKH